MSTVTPIKPPEPPGGSGDSVQAPPDDDMRFALNRLNTVQSYIVVCQLALEQQSSDADFPRR